MLLKPISLKPKAKWIFLSVILVSPVGFSGEVEVVGVKADCQAEICQFDVTLRHQDEGWDHYANRWRILSEEGQELGVRTLHHPHDNEQPFTRGLGGVVVPAGINRVQVIGRDSVHGESKPYIVQLRR
ncbi:hypothetical protein BGP75_14640 [Motiliproteus sp. MSK22-1]|nr:hypothetical protein BGP75_14640 [Motiliproteus sp. MSK22-1]